MPRGTARDTNHIPAVEHGGFTGINNVDDATVIGQRALRSCRDYDCRKDGILVTRPGQTSVSGTAAHSIWSNKDKTLCLYRTGTNIVRLNADETPTVIASGFSANRMIFRDGEAGRVYLTDGQAIGMVNSGVYTGLNTILPIDHFKDRSIAGMSIEFWHGRLYVIVGNIAYFSDPHLPFQFDLKRNKVVFNGPVTLFRGMVGGIFAADGKIKFMSGSDPVAGMPVVIRADYDAIPGTDVLIPGKVVKGEAGGMTIWFRTARGVAVGGDDGGYRSITEDIYQGAAGITGTGLYRHDLNYNRYLVVGKG